jgi:hypothetical protein
LRFRHIPGRSANPDVVEDAVQEEMDYLWDEIYHYCVDLPTTTIDCSNRFSNRV